MKSEQSLTFFIIRLYKRDNGREKVIMVHRQSWGKSKKIKRSQMRPFYIIGALGGTRTHNLLIRSQMLYPIKLRAQRLDILIEQKKYNCKNFFQFFLFFCTNA